MSLKKTMLLTVAALKGLIEPLFWISLGRWRVNFHNLAYQINFNEALLSRHFVIVIFRLHIHRSRSGSTRGREEKIGSQ